MKSKPAFTAGPWAATTRQGSWDWVVYSVADPNIEICQPFHDGTEFNEEGEANAHLIAEAGTIAHETGLTPRQLAERCRELLTTLKVLLAVVKDARSDESVDAMTDAGGYLCGDVMSEAVEAAERCIVKATRGVSHD